MEGVFQRKETLFSTARVEDDEAAGVEGGGCDVESPLRKASIASPRTEASKVLACIG